MESSPLTKSTINAGHLSNHNISEGSRSHGSVKSTIKLAGVSVPSHGSSHWHRGHGHSHDDSDDNEGYDDYDDDANILIVSGPSKRKKTTVFGNQGRIVFMGVLMLVYSFGEIGFSLKAKSLTMFTDGLHNLSDAVSLGIALWAERIQTKVKI